MNNLERIIERLISESIVKNSVLYLKAGEPLPEETAKYKAIVLYRGIEEEINLIGYLHRATEHLCEDGQMFLVADNRLGLRYFSGENDPYTHQFGDGIDGYIHTSSPTGRCYALHELKEILVRVGLNEIKTYSILPTPDHPKILISEDFQPNDSLSLRCLPEYREPDKVFLEEEYVIDSLLANGMLPAMANGVLLQASRQPITPCVKEIVLSSERKKESSFMTVLTTDSRVEKHALYPEGEWRLAELVKNAQKLKDRGIKAVQGRLVENKKEKFYETGFVTAPIANVYLKKLFFDDRGAFIKAIDSFRNCILRASDIVSEEGHIQQTAYPDMMPLNAFFKDDEYEFFDQEYTLKDYPADAIITRMLLIVYELDMKMELALPKSFFFERYGLMPRLDEWLRLARSFTDEFTSFEYDEGQRQTKDDRAFLVNRERLNYSESVYEQLMYNPVAGIENKELYIFGCCEGTAKFIEMYQRDFTIRAVVTSEVAPSLKEYAGYPVLAAMELRSLNKSEYRVVICTPEYESVRRFLKTIGVGDIVVYRPEKIYPGRQASKLYGKHENGKKTYHIGYVAGVFDLFHVGHLNLLRRAKEMCDYLIVGVVTDEGVRDFKKTEPVIPFEERIELIRGCRYVDEAVEIPYFNRGTIEAFEKYHFDVQFSGSDYENEPLWKYHKAWLEEHGATMVFFPYTAGVSSTKIKGKIR